ncbi:MAG: P-type conjugative transfer protein TrbG [Succinivibrionaceae bacterium]|nr:P-type conjugative transfer protein TrbG [Succinivibrionaceae bacterium]
MRNPRMLALTLCALCAEGLCDSALEEYGQRNGRSYVTEGEERLLADLGRFSPQGSHGYGLAAATAPGEVTFTFGGSTPTIVCALVQLTDVALEPGERINDVQLGDTVRWTVTSSVSGSGDEEVEHLIIKPNDTGLRTTMLVTTDRRAYHLNLVSDPRRFMPAVRFSYPGSALSGLRRGSRGAPRPGGGPGTLVDSSRLAHARDISGDPAICPLEAYHDGRHTFVEMPPLIMQRHVPALLEVGDGGLFSADPATMLNYRVEGNRFIAEGVHARLRVMGGAGGAAQSCDIRFGEAS